MDNQAKLQKRKRAETIQNQLAIKGIPEGKSTIIIDTLRYGKPFIKEDDLDDSNID
jgi:hypothetical protein